MGGNNVFTSFSIKCCIILFGEKNLLSGVNIGVAMAVKTTDEEETGIDHRVR